MINSSFIILQQWKILTIYLQVESFRKWAKQKSLQDDPLFQVRDLELTLHEVQHKLETLKCSICNKTFTARKILLRHQRTAHAESSYQCGICNAKFGRIDILHKHEKAHEKESKENSNKKRKLQAEKTIGSKKSKINDPERASSTSTCNWCHHERVLVENKPFCNLCKQQGRECKTCHRPVSLHLYNAQQICAMLVKRSNNGEGQKPL